MKATVRVAAFAILLGAGLPVVVHADGTGSTPFSGTPLAVPGTWEAENFDRGGEAIAYHDTTPGNAGGQYRPSEGVDIFVSRDPSGGGYSVEGFEAGEWLAYTINVPASGNYDIELRVATRWDFPNSAYHIEIDGANVTGTVVLPTTNSGANSGWSNFQWLGRRTVPLTAGTHVIKVVSEVPYFAFNAVRATTTPALAFEAEDFDLGGEGVAYHDTTPGNQGGQYRPSEDVDIFVSRDPSGGGYSVGNFEAGEWLAYTINVPASGNYDIELRVATRWDFPNSAYHVEIDGVNVTGTVVLPTTNNDPNGGWSNFEWLGKKTVQLAAGTHVLKVVSEVPYFAFNAVRATATPFEAEDFDLGGEGVAYHDTTPGNAGGQYRPSEDVDIFVSRDPSGGGYSVENFEAGEWLAYTIDVPAGGNYDIELRVATRWDFPNSAYHIEIDGANVTGTVVLPTTNSGANSGWSNFQWLGRRTVPLTAGTHVIKVVSEVPYFVFNAVRVTATLPPRTTTRFEENAATATYSGSWTRRGAEIATFSGGSAVSSNVAGSSVRFSFTGTAVSWIGLKCNVCGIAAVSIDGGAPSTVNTGNSAPVGPGSGATSEVMFSASGLDPAVTHTMVITVTGTTTSADAHIAVDAFDVTGGDVTGGGVSTATRIEDTAVSYTGTWIHGTDSRASGGTFAESEETGAVVTLRFTGTGVRWRSARNFNNGIASVWVDGVFVRDVDTYGPSPLEVAEFAGVDGLTRGAYTLTITVTGTKNPASSGTWVIIDAFDVTP